MNNKQLRSGIRALVKGRGEMGQVQILAIFLFLLLIPTTAIIAQNSSIQANFSGEITGETAPVKEVSTAENQTQETPHNTTPNGVNVTQEPTNTTVSTNETTNITAPANQTNVTVTGNTTIVHESNQTGNQKSTNQTTVNETVINQTHTNQTVNETPENVTDPSLINVTMNVTLNETVNITDEISYPVLDVGIVSPESITRGGMVELRAYAKNTGNAPAYDVIIEWVLPDGFDISTGSGSYDCQEVAPETSCWNNIVATVPLSSELGLKNIGVRVSYSG